MSFEKEKELMETLEIGDYFIIKDLDENRDDNTNEEMIRYSNQTKQITHISGSSITGRVYLSLKGCGFWNWDYNHVDYLRMSNTLDEKYLLKQKVELPDI